MMNEVDKRITIVKLTICRNMPSVFEDVHMRKEGKYALLVNDPEQKNCHVSYQTLEIWILGHFTSSAQKAIKCVDSGLSKSQITVLLLSLSKIVISCSKFIFQTRPSQSWTDSLPLAQ